MVEHDINRRVAVLVFYTEEGLVLMQERTSKSKFGEDWGYVGGGIDGDETPEEAIIREAKEELDWELEEKEYIGDFYQGKRFMFIAPLGDKLTQFKILEGDSLQLFTIDDAKKLNLMEGEVDGLVLVEKTLRKKKILI